VNLARPGCQPIRGENAKGRNFGDVKDQKGVGSNRGKNPANSKAAEHYKTAGGKIANPASATKKSNRCVAKKYEKLKKKPGNMGLLPKTPKNQKQNR